MREPTDDNGYGQRLISDDASFGTIPLSSKGFPSFQMESLVVI
ncbi:hypothetical protein [Streptococcus halichoeri]|nr:hypothetical protein [Streptococcus halichoeri]